jgi:hypothetical protein
LRVQRHAKSQAEGNHREDQFVCLTHFYFLPSPRNSRAAAEKTWFLRMDLTVAISR